MSYEQENENIETSLVDQLGTDPVTLARSKVDEIKLMNLVDSEQLGDQFHDMLYWSLQYGVVEEKLSFNAAIMKYYPKLTDALNGRGQNMILKAETVKKGGTVNADPPPPKPSLLQRLTNADEVRDYESYKERKEAGLE